MLKPFGFREHVIHLAQRCTSPLIRAQELQLLFVRDSEGIYSSSMFCVFHLRFSIFSLWQSTGSASSGGVSYLVFFISMQIVKPWSKALRTQGQCPCTFKSRKWLLSNCWSLAFLFGFCVVQEFTTTVRTVTQEKFLKKLRAGRLGRFKNIPEFGFEAPNFQLWQLEVPTVEEVRPSQPFCFQQELWF